MTISTEAKRRPIDTGHVLFRISTNHDTEPVYSFKPFAAAADVNEIKKLMDEPFNQGAWLGRIEGARWVMSQVSHVEELRNVDVKISVYVITTVEGYQALVAERGYDSFPMRYIRGVDCSAPSEKTGA